MICNWISLNKQSNEENQTVLKKEAEGLCFGVCFFFFLTEKFLYLLPIISHCDEIPFLLQIQYGYLT